VIRASQMVIIASTVLWILVAAPSVAFSSNLKVLSGSGVQPVMIEIIPQFERTSGHKVTFDYGTVGRLWDGRRHGRSRYFMHYANIRNCVNCSTD
jgi:ABC-type molybdate transport system substrate-binding protein